MPGDPKDIPNIFQSDAAEKPFEVCLVCNRHLLEEQTPYVVEKAFKKYASLPEVEDATLFEYAICLNCANDMKNSMSKPSQKALAEFVENNDTFKMRMHRLMAAGETNITAYLSHCAFTGEPLSETDEYQVLGMFHGAFMQYSAFPYAIGSKAMDIIAELLSDETIDEMDRFRDTYLGGPPELESLFKGKPVMVL